MLKKSLIAIAVLAIAIPAIAGDTKIHDPWPKGGYIPQTVCTIDVHMNVGYYIHVKDQGSILVSQKSISGSNAYFTYYGCKNSDVYSNFDAILTASAKAADGSAAGGSWSVQLGTSDADLGSSVAVDSGKDNIRICVTGKKVAIEKLVDQGGKKKVKVAEVTIKVVPAS